VIKLEIVSKSIILYLIFYFLNFKPAIIPILIFGVSYAQYDYYARIATKKVAKLGF